MTNLEKSLLIIIGLGVCVIIACLLNISMRDGGDVKPCTSRSCIKTASQILKQIDGELDPCNDFFKFSCGKLINTTHEKQRPYIILRNQIEKQLHILMEPINAKDYPIINYQKRLFKACINETEATRSVNALQEILKELGGWPVVEGDTWNENRFDLVDTIGQLRRKGLEFSSILTISLLQAPHNQNKKIIKVNFPYASTMHDNFYLNLMVNVAVSFGANKTWAHDEMTKVHNFITSMEKSRDIHLFHNDSKLHEVTYDKLQEFQEQFGDLDWLKLINLILDPVSKIDPQDIVVFPDIRFIHTYLNFINETDKRVLCNYILWCAVEDLLPLLSSQLQAKYNDYKCLSAIPRRTRHDMCKLAIKQNFGPIPAHLAYAKKHLSREIKKKAEEIYKRVKLEFDELLKGFHLSSENRDKVETTFSTLQAIIGLKEDRIDDALFDKFFKGDLELVEEDGFLRTFLHFKWKVENVWIENVHLSNVSISDLLIFYQIPRTELTYILQDHFLIIPVGMLHNLFYEGDKPILLHFATLGRNIGTALFNIFSDLDLGEESNNEIWLEISKTKCVRDNQIHKDDFMDDNYDKVRISERVGLKTAYNAYKKWAEENKEEFIILGIDYNPRQLFWILSMSDLCLIDDTYIVDIHKNNLGVRQNSDFLNDFSCTFDDAMSLRGKCNDF